MSEEELKHTKELLDQALDLFNKLPGIISTLKQAVDSNEMSEDALQKSSELVEACLFLQGSDSGEFFYS